MKYIMSSSKWEGAIELEYHDNGYLAQARFPEVIDIQVIYWFATHMPTTVFMLDWFREHTGAKIEEYIGELTFDEFWNAYDKKTGSKEMARQLWEGSKKTINKRPINYTDRANIMRVIKRYIARYQCEKKEFQPLATTFLYQRRWESELEALQKRSYEVPPEYARMLMEKWSVKNTEKNNI